MIRGDVGGIGSPDCSGEVPEVYGLAVCDKEDLAGDGVGGVGGGVGELVDHALGSEDVGVGGVLDVREVEEVVVGAELELCLVVFEDRDHPGNCLPVTGPKRWGEKRASQVVSEAEKGKKMCLRHNGGEVKVILTRRARQPVGSKYTRRACH